MWTRFDQKDLEKFLKHIINTDVNEIRLEMSTMAEFEFDEIKIEFDQDLPTEVKEELINYLKYSYSAGAVFGAMKQLEKFVTFTKSGGK